MECGVHRINLQIASLSHAIFIIFTVLKCLKTYLLSLGIHRGGKWKPNPRYMQMNHALLCIIYGFKTIDFIRINQGYFKQVTLKQGAAYVICISNEIHYTIYLYALWCNNTSRRLQYREDWSSMTQTIRRERTMWTQWGISVAIVT